MLQESQICSIQNGPMMVTRALLLVTSCGDWNMTEDNKKSIYWTGGMVVALTAIVGLLWLAGLFGPTGVQ